MKWFRNLFSRRPSRFEIEGRFIMCHSITDLRPWMLVHSRTQFETPSTIRVVEDKRLPSDFVVYCSGVRHGEISYFEVN